MKALFFATQQDLRKWFIKNHLTAEEMIVGYYKKNSGIPSVDWPLSVDEALCFGWIDGIRKSIDDKSYQIRFTPRRANSHWSKVNIKKIELLLEKKLIYPAGIKAWEKRDKKKIAQASYEREIVKLDKAFEEKIKSNSKAWVYFNNLAPSYKKQSIHWVMSAKQEKTRLSRLDVLISSSEKGEIIPPLKWSKKK